MKELLKQKLIEYQNDFNKNQAECIALMKEGKPWEDHAREGASLKMMIEVTIIELNKYL
jgi:hypothetical protein